MGVLMSWDEGQTLGARWEHAAELAGAVHPHWQWGRSYAGFAQALVRETPRVLGALTARFRRHMQALGGRCGKVRGWEAFAVDGSRLEAPHTAANEAGLGCAGRDKTAPQVFLTTVWQMGLGLPWDFRVGPGTDSERHHLRAMVAALPPQALLVADAGFVSYDLCRLLLRSGRSFLLRVGSNVTLLQDLGYYRRERQDLVYLWPHEHQRRGRPLVLRLLRRRRGRQTMYLLTNVLDRRQLTKADAAELYDRRWGEEVFFRSYKQTLQRRTLLSRTPETCLAESQWTLMGLWLLGLLTAARVIARGDDPATWSVARSRDAVRRALRYERPRRGGRRPLGAWLAVAVKDRYQRHGSKTARNYPRKKREKPPGPPKIKAARPPEIKRAARLKPPNIVLRWTA
jgi:hypothetical protein